MSDIRFEEGFGCQLGTQMLYLLSILPQERIHL